MLEKERYKKMEKRDSNFIYAIATPFFVALVAGIYAYTEFARNGITSPDIWIASLIATFLVFVVVYMICMTIYLWRFT